MRPGLFLSISLFLINTTVSFGQDAPGVHYEHLKFLNDHIGHWTYEGIDGEGRKVTGEETAKWFFNRNYMRVTGRWQPEGQEAVEYELIVGWYPVKERIVMVAPLSDGGHLTRVGSYDPVKKTWQSEQNSVDGKGHKYSSICSIVYDSKDQWTATWTNSKKNGESQPDAKITAKRVSK